MPPAMVVHKKKERAKKDIPIKVQFVTTGELFPVRFVKPDMKIKELRASLELATGIPSDLQKVYYLDEADMPDNTEVRHHDIVAGAVISMEVWHTWKELVEAIVANDPEWALRLGVSKNTSFSTPNSDYMLPKQRMNWIQKRANIALFIAAHRGYHSLCQKLIQWGADVNSVTPEGRTPLHVAATQDHGDVINLLLKNGTNIDRCDVNGLNALTIANQFGHKGCERHLFMFRWQERAKAMKPQFLNPPLMAFQRFDSFYPKWRMGPHAQVYIEKLVPPGEFVGSAINAPLRSWHRAGSAPNVSELRRGSSQESEGSRKGSRKQVLSFEAWLAAKQRQDRQRAEALQQQEEAQREAEAENGRQRKFEQREEYEKSKSYETWMAEQQHQSQSGAATRGPRGGGGVGGKMAATQGAGGGTGPAGKRPEAKEDMKSRLRSIMSRHKLDDSLTAYEQWLKDRGGLDGDHASSSLPYQTMIREFCHKNCPHHGH